MAREKGIPTIINCVGAPRDFTAAQQIELTRRLEEIPCVAVRDEFSARRLIAAGIKNVHCVADNLWYINKMHPKAEMNALRCELARKTGRDFSTPYIIMQYGTTGNTDALAHQLKEFKKKSGYRICLMAVNYCHEDRLGMQLLAKAGEDAFEVFDDYLQPPEMIAVISGASAFVGTSLHGNLIAASYGVPFVGIDMYSSFVSKMDGIFSMDRL